MMLNDSEIEKYLGALFQPDTASAEMVGPAKYYLTLGEKNLILPDGTQYRGHSSALEKPFTLRPGQTALVSTKERLTMPFNVAGIFGPTSTLSNAGIFFFGGMLVDPGFGRRLVDQDGSMGPLEVADATPLSFYLANVGAETLQLRPGEDRIASIAFVLVNSVSGRAPSTDRIDPSDRPPAERFRRELAQIFDEKGAPGVLGLVGEVTELSREVDKVKASVDQVVLFGVILLAVTMLTTLSTLVAGSDQSPLEITKWWEAGGAIGIAISAVAALVGIFYLSVLVLAKAFGLTKRKRLLSDLKP
jgi:deoxycytidine triphosphate deaminase